MPHSKPHTIDITRAKIWNSDYRQKTIGWIKERLSGKEIKRRLQAEGFEVSYDSILLFGKALQANPRDYGKMRIAEVDKIIDAVEKHAKAILMLEKQIDDSFKQERETGIRSKTLTKDLMTFNKLIISYIQTKKELGLVGNPA